MEDLKSDSRPEVQVKMDIDHESTPPAQKPIPSAITPPAAKIDDVSELEDHILQEPLERRSLTEKEHIRVLKALDNIEADELSDIEDHMLKEQFKAYEQRREKRNLDVENIELGKRKVWIFYEPHD